MRKIFALCVILVFVFLFKTAYADELSELKEEMKKMQSQMQIMQKKIEALETEKAKGPEALSAKDILIPRWKDGLSLTTEDKQFEMKIGGRLHLDSAYFKQDAKVEDKVGASKDGLEVRRAHIALKGSMYQDYIWQLEYDFAPTSPLLRDSYIGLKNIPYLGTVRLGHFFEPFGLDELISTNYMTFLENALPVNTFAPYRNMGIASASTAFNERVEWELGVFRDADNQGRVTANEYNFTGRLTGLPYYKDEGKKLFHIGASYTLRHPKQTLQYSAKPEANLAQTFVNTAAFNAKSANIFGLESIYLNGPLSLQGEYIGNVVDQGGDRHDTYFQGLYAEVSYFLTGESRPYLKPSGVFGRVRPKKNFSFKEKGLGAWEVALRYSWLDLEDDNINGGILSDTTLGLNWYLNPNMRIMCDYIFAHLNGRGDTDILETRFQVDF